ncbi:GvpL/GvpF family gas vesicle protein [Oscillatoria sp. FACHB-1407]|uniref:gas vesicle protein GvpF n=1 Tax=Oscillatoria sp. FACHB-1407 TaxID=2692847 RepID=UPI00168766DF|nr:GvpL/GvpF family gas vesicle protein [Oscillatoria sp. FACHB-1407]MBD2460068.1 GvpL/GvpF family gas vesicle protein [Oscillatoria sp. FACHB-1407]
MGYGLYLYGIFPLPGPQDLDLEGLDKQPVGAHTIDEFVFLYSEAQQERYLASRKNLLGHERVLEQAMEQGYRTLLPLQFGLIIENWNSVEQQLITPQGNALKQLFVKLDGKREVGVKVFWDQSAELETLMQEDEELRIKRDRHEGKPLSMDQVVQIGQAIEQAVTTRKESIIKVFQTNLNALAVEVAENDVLTDTMIYNAAYLIPWDAEAEFGEQVEQLDLQFEGRLKIRYNNFTAPYNFAQVKDRE